MRLPDDCDVFERGWFALLQRFHTGVSKHSFSGPSNADERGLLVECGKHKVQLGSSGTLRVLDLPCGGGWRLSE